MTDGSTILALAELEIKIDSTYQPKVETKAVDRPEAATLAVDKGQNDKERGHDEMVIVELNNIHKTYLLGIEGVPALRGVSLKILRGEFIVIFGTSGGGKTSLLNIIGTIDKPTKGELKVCGTTINAKTKDEVLAKLRLSGLGFVFQTFNLIGSLTALENVELPMTLKGTDAPADRRRLALESLERVGLASRVDHFPSQLSGGEQQRVTIARAIANNPRLLLLDEPTGDLDTKNSHKILDLLVQLNEEQGMTMVMVTHDVYLKNFAKRVVWMRDGKIAKIETISQQSRNEALADLRRNILLLQNNKKPTAPSYAETEGNILTGIDATLDQLPSQWQRTSIRQPTEYEPFAYGQHRKFNSNGNLAGKQISILSPNTQVQSPASLEVSADTKIAETPEFETPAASSTSSPTKLLSH